MMMTMISAEREGSLYFILFFPHSGALEMIFFYWKGASYIERSMNRRQSNKIYRAFWVNLPPKIEVGGFSQFG